MKKLIKLLLSTIGVILLITTVILYTKKGYIHIELSVISILFIVIAYLVKDREIEIKREEMLEIIDYQSRFTNYIKQKEIDQVELPNLVQDEKEDYGMIDSLLNEEEDDDNTEEINHEIEEDNFDIKI